MIQPWIILLVAIVYLSLLFAVASYGDRTLSLSDGQKKSKPNIYAFSLAIYCTTWTFFGSVGLASTGGIAFLAIYLGPVMAITLGFPLFKRIVKLSKEERITSVADFIGSRYGKNIKVAAVAAVIAVIGTVPYIALQLKAISGSVNVLLVSFDDGLPVAAAPFGDISVMIALILALFAILFGTRHADATENQHGLMLAVATESVVKLIAFISIGVFVTYFVFDGVQDLFAKAVESPNVQNIASNGVDVGNFLILTVLSLTVFLLLPRQFHVAVVENNSIDELRRARWLFPVYLVLINLFVIPIAIAGTLKFGSGVNADDYVLLLPMLESEHLLGLLAFIGGLSAGTAMVVVACVALAIMISNDLVLPWFLRSRASLGQTEPEDMENRILNIRRTAILVVLTLAYVYYKSADNTAALASIGLVSFAAIAQLAPSFFGGLFWKRATARGAMMGMMAGFFVWTYTLLLPTLLPANSPFVTDGLFGLTILKPQALFESQFNPLANGVIWSLVFNSFAFIIGSLSRAADPQERMQASLFVSYQSPVARLQRVGKSTVTVAQLQETLARYLGTQRTRRSFNSYWASNNLSKPEDDTVIDNDLLQHSEQLLASAVGASSSRLVHTLLIKRFDKTSKSSIKLLDEASKALQFNRDVLQTALDQLEQGISVFDGEFRLASWNRQFRDILNLPSKMGQAGIPLSELAREIITSNNLSNAYPGEEELAFRLVNQSGPWHLEMPDTGEVLEITTSAMPEGGIVITWNNITERVLAAEALRNANETLEKRVEERTGELEVARRLADQANASKTRFLAAAGHDILQPLNAARLYSETLKERIDKNKDGQLAENISRSLGSVEEILGSILEISRLDTARPEINKTALALKSITEQLQLEFTPIAAEEGLELAFVHSSKWIYSDGALLRRLLQNLISNALKFTHTGKVLVGCRKRGKQICVDILDTGIGMDDEQQKIAFAEFTRLNEMKNKTPGLGLGLSIVDRIAKSLDHKVIVESTPGKGTRFRVILDTAEAMQVTQSVSRPRQKAGSGNLQNKRVLCIDNDPAILDGMKALLNQWGAKNISASSYEDAIQSIKDTDYIPDVILVDYHLDETTGIWVHEKLQKKLGVTIPGVLITADRSREVRSKAREAGLVVLNKPLKPAALRAVISQTTRQQVAAE